MHTEIEVVAGRPGLPLIGKKVALAGRFASMNQREAAEMVRALGGEVVASPTPGTAFLVIGQDGWPLADDGRPAGSLERARRLQAAGQELVILREEAFLERLELSEQQSSVHRRYTLGQLGAILGLPGQRLRAWMRAGLIVPVETVHRLAYFDFGQVASAKRLYELIESGVPLQRVRDSLQQMRTWLPGIEQPLAQLSLLEDRGRLLVRLAGGQLAEPHGQMRLDFDAAEDCDPVQIGAATPEQWFDQAIQLESQGQPAEAAAAYQEAMALEPNDPVLHFNYGNVLYALGATGEAVVHFRRATELDAAYAEAWNNLGSVLSEQGEFEEALRCIRRALQLVPSYGDAHYNLGQTLYDLGDHWQARAHWKAYLQYDSISPWADEVRRRLADAAADP